MAQVKKDSIMNDILNQSFEMMKKDGYEATSMRHIAVACHISVSNLYNYFDNKEAILDALVGEFYKKIITLSKINRIKPVSLCQDDYLEYLIAATASLQSYIINNKELLYILIFKTKGSKYESFCDEIVERYYEYEMWSVTGAFSGSKVPTLKGPSSIMIKNLCGMYIELTKCYLSENKSEEWFTKNIRELNLFVISGLGIYLKDLVK
ncbi:MAG: TetR/AcrR family transcriptional regulator [Peptostreptococcaceae bacterium]|nr:TetR/AcrR family transcriptional regulator [Peptostreptococcaceae bacterium]